MEKKVKLYADYFETLLWVDELDAYSVDDINAECIEKSIKEIEKFLQLSESILCETDYTLGQTLHDFYLTRQGHGVGFWENDFCNEIQGEALTDIAKKFGEVCVLVENKKVYIY